MPRRRDAKRGRPQRFTRPPSERDWRGYRLVKLALRANPAHQGSTRIISKALQALKHRAVLTKDQDVSWQIMQARDALKDKLYRMKLGLNPKRKRSARSTDPILALFGSAHKRGSELRHYREKWEQAQTNYMRFLNTDTQKARKWARISAKLTKRIGKIRDRSNPHPAIDAYNRAPDRDAEAELRTPRGEKRRQKHNRAVLARLRSRRRNPKRDADSYIIQGPADSDGEILYWSNADGWVSRDAATVFKGRPSSMPMEAVRLVKSRRGRRNPPEQIRYYDGRGFRNWSTKRKTPSAADALRVHRAILAIKGGRRNPKRDGTPTRGELRKVKYVQHLKVIAEKGQEARGRIATLTGTLPKPEAGIFKPLGKRVITHAESGPRHADAIPEQAPPVVVALPSHPEAANINSRIGDIDMLLKDFKEQLRELGDSEEAEAEIGVIHGEIEKFARQKKALREKLDSLTTATNPRRRGRHVRRMSPARIRAVMRASRNASIAIRRVRIHLRRALQALRSRRGRH